MKALFALPAVAREGSCRLRTLCSAIALSAGFIVIGCTTGEFGSGADATRGPIVQKPVNFETALKQNQAALAERNGSHDLALYNIGVVLAHPANPRRDGIKAARVFKTLVAEHPRSQYVEQAKTWIEVLEQQQKLAEEKRTLARERENLLEERQRLNYANDKSQQLDMQIEKRRRQSLGR
jgi:hypothetical protein